MKLACPRQIFEKSSNIKFHENLSIGSWFVPCEQTWRRCSQFCQYASKSIRMDSNLPQPIRQILR